PVHTSAIDQVFSKKNDNVGDIPKDHIAMWREITERGLLLMNFFSDFYQSDWRDKLPLARMVPTTHRIPTIAPPPPGSGGWAHSNKVLKNMLDEQDFFQLMDIAEFFFTSLGSDSGELHGFLIPNYSGSYKEANSKHAYQFLEDVRVILSNYMQEYESLLRDAGGHVYSKEAKQILQLKKSSKGVIADLDRINDYAQYLANTITRTNKKLFPRTHTWSLFTRSKVTLQLTILAAR
ncbi:hypothetical protein GE061_017213, partial [Apolygus lucorum]